MASYQEGKQRERSMADEIEKEKIKKNISSMQSKLELFMQSSRRVRRQGHSNQEIDKVTEDMKEIISQRYAPYELHGYSEKQFPRVEVIIVTHPERFADILNSRKNQELEVLTPQLFKVIDYDRYEYFQYLWEPVLNMNVTPNNYGVDGGKSGFLDKVDFNIDESYVLFGTRYKWYEETRGTERDIKDKFVSGFAVLIYNPESENNRTYYEETLSLNRAIQISFRSDKKKSFWRWLLGG